MSLSQDGGSTTPRTVRKKRRIQSDDAGNDHETPRAKPESIPYPSFGLPTTTHNAPTLSSRSLASDSSNAGSKSPSERVGDLQLVQRTITYTGINDERCPLPTAAQELASKIRKIASGNGLIPESQKVTAQQRVINEEFYDYNFGLGKPPEDIPGSLSASGVWNQIIEIMDAAALCEREEYSEPAWNEEVHFSLLKLALRGWRSARRVSYVNVTTARIDGRSGGLSKMVDYALVLVPEHDIHKVLIAMLRERSLQSINHTRAEYVRFKPITVSIETKRPGTDEDMAKVQLGVWAEAHLERLRILSRPDAVLPILPEVVVQGHDWRLKIAAMTGDGNVILYGDWVFGETRTIIGIYKIIAAIQTLAQWSVNTYQPWFLKEVLDIEKSS